jgi:hypothetical protein
LCIRIIKNNEKNTITSIDIIKAIEINDGLFWNWLGATRKIIIKAVTSEAIPAKKA